MLWADVQDTVEGQISTSPTEIADPDFTTAGEKTVYVIWDDSPLSKKADDSSVASDSFSLFVAEADLSAGGISEEKESWHSAPVPVNHSDCNDTSWDEDINDLIPLNVELTPGDLPDGHKVRLRAGSKNRVRIFWRKGLKGTPQAIVGPEAGATWEKDVSEAALADSAFYLEGVKPGASTIDFEYCDSAGAVIDADAVTVRVMDIVVKTAPDYLFANARYAAPVRFEVLGGPAEVGTGFPILSSVKVKFYCAAGDGSVTEELRLTSDELIPTSSDVNGRICRIKTDGSLSEMTTTPERPASGAIYEAYVRSSKFRDFTIHTNPGDKYTTEYAFFQVIARIKPDANSGTAVEVRSVDLPDPNIGDETDVDGFYHNRGPRITLFGDKKIAAWDMRVNSPSASEFETGIGALYSDPAAAPETRSTMCTELAYWEPEAGFARYMNPHHFQIHYWDKDPDDEKHGTRSGTRPGDGSTKYEPDNVRERKVIENYSGAACDRDVFEYEIPYWTAEPITATSDSTDFKTYICLHRIHYDVNKGPENWPTTTIYSGEDDCKEAFEHVTFGSEVDATSKSFKVSVSMKQNACDTYKGEYISRNFGMRIGGYAVASYGGKHAPCFGEDDQVEAPWGSDGETQEKAMDLDLQTGWASITAAQAGEYNLRTASDTTPGDTGAALMVNTTFFIVDAAIVISGQHYLLMLSGLAQSAADVGLAMAAENNGYEDDAEAGSLNGMSMASFQTYWMKHNVKGTGTRESGSHDDYPAYEVKTITPIERKWNGDRMPGAGKVTISEERSIGVGQQITVWGELSTMCQLIAEDTSRIPLDTDKCSATAEFRKTTLDIREIRVKLVEQ